jgi:hypothetical protein
MTISRMKGLMAVPSISLMIVVLGTVNFGASYAQQITSEQKSQLCNPNNPKLNFVNSTESKICGIPESVKNQTTTNNSATASQPVAPSAVLPQQ